MPIPPIVLYLFPFLGGLLAGLDGVNPLSLAGVLAPPVLTFLANKTAKDMAWAAALAVAVALLGTAHLGLRDHVLEAQNTTLMKLARSRREVILQGTVNGIPVPTKTGMRAQVTLSPVGPFLALYIRDATTGDLSPGDLIRFSCRLSEIRNRKTPGAFDRELWWRERGVLVQGFTSYPMKCIVIRPAASHTGLEYMRQGLVRVIQNALPRDIAPVALALVVGEKAWIPWHLKEEYYKAGVGHVLAVSGVHMATVFLFFSVIVRAMLSLNHDLLLRLPVRQISLVAGGMASLVYLGLSGLSPSATRAFLMVLAFSLCFLLRRELSPVDALFLAAWVIVSIDPYSVKSPSFLLSFVAVFFIIWFGDWIARGGYVSNVLKISIVAWLATMPISSSFFHRMSVLAVPTNLVIVPVVGLILIPLLIASVGLALLTHQNPATDLLWWCVAKVTRGLNATVGLAAGLEPSWLTPHYFTPIESLSFYGILLGTGLYLIQRNGMDRGRTKVRGSKVIIVSTVALLFSLIFTYYIRGRATRMVVLDVGQGLSQVVLTPQKTVVIDGGGGIYPYDMGGLVVVPYLHVNNRRTVDYLILSHWDMDHAGGAIGILQGVSVKEVIAPSHKTGSPLQKRILDITRKKQIKYVACTKRQTLILGGGTRLDLYPPEGRSSVGEASNNLGIVAYLSSGGHTILMPGDIERPREQELVEALPAGPVDVVVVPHHGSKTSSSPMFVRHFAPKIAIFSYGYKNSLGVPSPEVVRRYEELGTTLLDTVHNGTIEVSIKRNIIGGSPHQVLKATSMTN